MTTFREQYEQKIRHVLREDTTPLEFTGFIIACENANDTVADEGLDLQDERWFETWLWTYREWMDCPWLDGVTLISR